MSPKPKKSEPTDRHSQMLKLLNRNATAQDFKITTASHIQDSWKYVDFCDPLTKSPCLLLEWLFGARGILSGRMTKVEADEGVGKTSLLMALYGATQKTGNAICYHNETEGTPPPPDYIASFGCDPDRLYVARPRALEPCLQNIEQTVNDIRRDIDPGMDSQIMIGIDSISGLAPEDDIPNDDKGQTTDTGAGLGKVARVVSKWFQTNTAWLENKQVSLFVVAQYREKINTGSSFMQTADQKKTTIAARALNYYATYRLVLRSVPYKVDSIDIGEILTIKTAKNKLSPKNREISLYLIRNRGFDMVTPTVDWLRTNSPIVLPGDAQFAITQAGPRIACPMLSDTTFMSNYEGKRELLDKLYANQDLLMKIRETLRIRGFGFGFETDYMPTASEQEDAIGEGASE